MKTYFWNFNEQPLPIENTYKGQSCFIVSSGPSLQALDLSLLNQPGIVTFGLNNSPRAFRPDLWVSVDDPANFMISIWRDPLIKKFCMLGKRNKQLWDNTTWTQSRYTVGDCPNMVYYKDNEYFKPTAEWLDEPTINWGNHTDRCECGHMRGKDDKGKKESVCPQCNGRLFGVRSVFLAALKIAYVLGFRKVFLLGCDFKMTNDYAYAWQQERSPHSVKNNNNTYERLNTRFDKLRPVFENRGFYVFNATPDSGLKSFISIDYKDAIKMAVADFPETKNERTFGMYERKSVENDVVEQNTKIAEIKQEIIKVNGSDKHLTKKLNKQLEKAQIKYRNALEMKERMLTWTA